MVYFSRLLYGGKMLPLTTFGGKVCSEHMFGKKLNFGKHIFGTWMFGT